MSPVRPTKIQLHKQSATLELVFSGQTFSLGAEFLRVHSSSAEVKGHGPGQEVLVDGKISVSINTVKATGNYGLQILFDDGHSSGIYTWAWLKELCENHHALWQTYLKKLRAAGKSRNPHTSVIEFSPNPAVK